MNLKTSSLRLCSLVLATLLTVCFTLTAAGCVSRPPADKTQENAPPTVTDAPPPPATPAGIRPEFKEVMDSYEAFFDEYCRFMESFSKSGNTASMLSEYMRFLTRYAECMEELEAMDDGTLSDAELAYYNEVMLRISEKLLSCIN